MDYWAVGLLDRWTALEDLVSDGECEQTIGRCTASVVLRFNNKHSNWKPILSNNWDGKCDLNLAVYGACDLYFSIPASILTALPYNQAWVQEFGIGVAISGEGTPIKRSAKTFRRFFEILSSKLQF